MDDRHAVGLGAQVYDSDDAVTEQLEHHVQGALPKVLRYHKRVRTLEEWTCDEWGDELVRLWHLVRDTCDAQGWPFFDAIDYPGFARVCYDCSKKHPNVEA